MNPQNNAFTDAFFSPADNMGEIPFYWWNGDKLQKERIAAQLTMLHEKGIAGVQINYAHEVGGGEDNAPYGGFGRSIKGSPEQFSDEWWDFFAFAAHKCEELNMGIGVGDYTLAWIGNGYFTDKVAAEPDMSASNLTCEPVRLFCGDENSFSDDVLAAVYYADAGNEEPVIIYERGKGAVNSIKGFCEAYVIKTHITPLSINPLNPDCGKKIVEYYFEEFERRVPDLKPGTLNYFFQDELMFNTDIRTLWHENLRQGVADKYGYDVLGFIPHLFYNLGNITPKIRLNVADVKTQITENNYFKPIYEFHASRGLIYGCDQSSRGKKPDEFGDYFRTVRWFTAPGNDTPDRSADLIKVKVNSSIAHLYNRPRVWLEGYHSSGWGTTLESITAPTADNFIFGANLLNLHGLYYSTNGGFFEWAPPDFHFRMPYWDDEKQWLLKFKRLSSLLTTGSHRCDAAVFYPVSSFDYGENAQSCIDLTFSAATELFNNGIDFDFIDFQSFEKAKCLNGRLLAAHESYRVIVFCNTDCIRYSCIEKIKEFLDCGGTVIFCGITPYASDRMGLNDEVLINDMQDIISHPGCCLAANEKEVTAAINNKVRRSFLPDASGADKKVYVHRRVCANDNLYFVRYAEKDSVCRFEASGQPYLFDTYTEKISRLNGTITQGGFVFIKMPNEAYEDSVFIFTENNIEYDDEINTSGFFIPEITNKLTLDGEWDFELLPTLDNTYGDFYYPPGGIIGAQARFFDCTPTESDRVIPEEFEYAELSYCTDFSVQKISCEGNVKAVCEYTAALSEIPADFIFNGQKYTSEEILQHRRYGIINTENRDAAKFEQGYHGLKGKIYDDNMLFDNDSVFVFNAYSFKDCTAYLRLCGIKPDFIFINGKEISDFSSPVTIRSGNNRVTAGFIYDAEKRPDMRNFTEQKRAGLLLTTSITPTEQSLKLSKSDFANGDYLQICSTKPESAYYCFRFVSPPSLTDFEAEVFGELTAAFCNGKAMTVSCGEKGQIANKYTVINNALSEYLSEIVFFVKPTHGYRYASLIAGPVKLSCAQGKILPGDTSKMGALKNYSGKMLYSKHFTFELNDIDERVILKLNDVGATANVKINGSTAAVFTFAPFETDITGLLKDGENIIEITVSNTLCNHYSTVPTLYSNFPEDAKSGLIGPVEIITYKN